jgi:hypothetical protein
MSSLLLRGWMQEFRRSAGDYVFGARRQARRVHRGIQRVSLCIPDGFSTFWEVPVSFDVYGESAGARTQDQRLKRAMLYQLSYALE